ncbi:30S ribosome-binding factor RbfA [Croceiramulus getboli]|nr:30S ribosome-binding factor RbfA [Flavobacteriaceae bacterium YJPT1-3]
METNRQKKVAGVIQRDLADVLLKALKEGGVTGIIISVTKVTVTTDLSQGQAYLSVFPNDKAQPVLQEIQKVSASIKHEIAQRTKNQLRRMPELHYHVDDSLEYIDKIERSLKEGQNPLENPDLLDRRKKS